MIYSLSIHAHNFDKFVLSYDIIPLDFPLVDPVKQMKCFCILITSRVDLMDCFVRAKEKQQGVGSR